MITWVPIIIKNIRLIAVIALIVGCVVLWKDYEYAKKENVRIKDNASSIRKQDSLNYSKQTLSNKEIIEHLEYNNKTLANKIDAANIKMRRIESIMTTELAYKDTVSNEIKVDGIIRAIKENTRLEVPIVDETECLIIKGTILYDNNKLTLNIKDRKFTNITDVVAYWERKKGFLGIRWGKKQATVQVFNSCGETITKIIEKK